MKSGSQGNQEVLFPDAENKRLNHIQRGQEIVLPPDGAFEFDKNPGTEKLGLYISRRQIDPNIYLKPTTSEKPVQVAMNFGAKDLVPSGVFIAYMADDKPNPKRKAEVLPAKSFAPTEVVAKKKPTTPPLKHIVHKPQPVAKASKPAAITVKDSAQAPNIAENKSDGSRSASPAQQSESSLVTVVSNDTTGVLSADIELQHY